ncbi:PREDICTED: transcription elongation factor B polypeptide 3-like, partial [Buceros rhinoceros silvestris]|uniref:transcription elongation factor B polypeptide 3-like n=1 Tax=Buceros rhinoceros silvestris TaxID=175836 RepID=UPI0005289027
IIKTLKVLQDLDISLDILVETGIGKTVNSFRKHATAGNVAKTLVKQWKKLIPSEHKSGHRGRKQNTEKDEMKSSASKEIKPLEKSKASVPVSGSSNSTPISKKLNKQPTCSERSHQSRDSESQKECDNKECSSSGSKHASKGTNPEAKEERTFTDSKKASEKQHSSVANKDLPPLKEKPSKDASKQRNTKHVKKPKQKLFIKTKAKLSSDEEFEPPTMSFESYLTYDEVTEKRKRKACSRGERPKKCTEQNNRSLPQKTSTFSHAKEGEKDVKKCEGDQLETPYKKAKVASLQDLLNTPLPKFLTGISISSPPYAVDFKATAVEAPQQVSEMAQFTGRRLNSKMQVYSGTKTVCLSKMLTLYEQCIRVLQNNIDSLHEVGGVPFEILEPVLTRCTPEQLFRIEECNPMFTEESDHLWKKHCQRDFKNECVLECESWREMYLRLFNQREEKLKMLTKNILSAQSEKPKGRQVKMAYVTSAAKPPRNIRRQQEIHGTAGPATQFHPIQKCKTRISESRDRYNTSSNLMPASNSGSSSSSVMTQDGKKPIKKTAPIMRKTLKAWKSRAGRCWLMNRRLALAGARREHIARAPLLRYWADEVSLQHRVSRELRLQDPAGTPLRRRALGCAPGHRLLLETRFWAVTAPNATSRRRSSPFRGRN